MAKFNPDVPHPSDPNYLGYSKGVDADKSMSTLFSGVGSLFESAVKGGVKLMESGISEELRDRIQPLEDQHIAGIEAASGQAVTGVPGKSAQLRQELLEGSANVPPSMDRLKQRVGALEGARANGKLSETYYLGSLNQIAKEFRSRYPGFRDYVDTEIKRITGRDPANAYISSMIADYNSYQSGKDDEMKLGLQLAKQNEELPEMPQKLQQFLQGKISYLDMFKYVNEEKSVDFKHKRFKQDYELGNMGREEAAKRADVDVTNELVHRATESFNNLTVDVLGSSQKLSDVASDVMLGRKQLTAAQHQAVADKVAMGRKQAELRMIEFLNEPVKGPGGKITSRRQIIGEKKAEERMAGALQQWDLVRDSLTNKDYGAAFHHSRLTARIKEDEEFRLMVHPELGASVRLSAAVGNNPEFQKTIVIDHIAQKGSSLLKNYLTESRQRASTQFGATPDNPVTIKDQIDHLNRKAEQNPNLANDREIEETRNKILSMPTYIADPVIEDAAKRNLIIASFDPKNKGILDNIVRDHVKDGRQVQGRFQAFRRATSADITKEVFRLDKIYPGDQLAQKYTDWVESTYRSLFTKELADFDEIVAHKDHKITWDDKNMRFNVEAKPGTEFSGLGAARAREALREAKATIFRLNQGLESMKVVAEHSGRNVEAYLLDTIVASKNISKLENVGNLPDFMMKAIISTKMSKEKKEKMREEWMKDFDFGGRK